MTEDFELSKKIGYVLDHDIEPDEANVHPACITSILEVRDVKEFIRLLKEEITFLLDHEEDTGGLGCRGIIDKLAGGKLTQ